MIRQLILKNMNHSKRIVQLNSIKISVNGMEYLSILYNLKWHFVSTKTVCMTYRTYPEEIKNLLKIAIKITYVIIENIAVFCNIYQKTK